MKEECDFAEIISDTDEEENNIVSTNPIILKKTKTKKTIEKTKIVKPKVLLKNFYNEDINIYEIGVDEVGRGPLFGRVYTAAVILPKDGSFDCSMVKDSKKFTSKKKIQEAAQYVKEHALAWYISFEDEKKIDEINILQATQLSMSTSILEVRKQFNKIMKDTEKDEQKDYSYSLLIDGNYFKPVTFLNKITNKIEEIPYVTIEGGDNKYAAIAAASILAKVERDRYIEELCEQNPELAQHYGIDSNKGYGAKRHIEGIKEHGITIWHRRSFGICKTFHL
jgi:ribonuclease HII